MHAILALGASHLHANTNLELKQTVDRHRALAMNGLLDFDPQKDIDKTILMVSSHNLKQRYLHDLTLPLSTF